jgi:hypothetical protein
VPFRERNTVGVAKLRQIHEGTAMEEEFEADTAGEDQVNAMFVELRGDMPLSVAI